MGVQEHQHEGVASPYRVYYGDKQREVLHRASLQVFRSTLRRRKPKDLVYLNTGVAKVKYVILADFPIRFDNVTARDVLNISYLDELRA